MTDFQKRIAALVAALPDGDKHGKYARFCRDVERVTGAKLAKSYLSNWLTGYQVPGPFWMGVIDQYEKEKNKPDFICTECGGDATVAYTSGRRKEAWNGMVKKGERVCMRCGAKRGIRFFNQ